VTRDSEVSHEHRTLAPDFDSFDVCAAFDESVGTANRATDDIDAVLRRYRGTASGYEGDLIVDEWNAPSIAGVAAAAPADRSCRSVGHGFRSPTRLPVVFSTTGTGAPGAAQTSREARPSQ